MMGDLPEDAQEAEDASDLEECYVPKRPLVFDKTGKCLIYTSPQDIGQTTKLFGICSAASMLPVYCFMRAI